VVEVTEVREAGGGVVVVELVDRWPDHAVVPAAAPDGPVLREAAGRGDARVRLTVVRTPDGWRIETGERSG
jgi:hypothetical protein